MALNDLHKYKQADNYSQFYKEIERLLPGLRRYVLRRLQIAEKEGVIPKGFYKPEDIIDEVYLEIYNRIEHNWTEKRLKTELFEQAMNKLDEIINKESLRTATEDIDRLVEAELSELEEKFTVDAEGELVLVEELEDQQLQDEEIYLIADSEVEDRIVQMLQDDKRTGLSKEEKGVFYRLLSAMKGKSRSIVEMYVFAGLEEDEISEVHGVKRENVNKIISSFTDKLRKLLKIK